MFGCGGCALVVLAQQVEGGDQVENEDGSPAEKKQQHDHNQHIDYLLSLALPTRFKSNQTRLTLGKKHC